MAKRLGRGRPSHPDVLTPAEWSAVDAVRHGMSNGQIARRRGVSIDAVKYHLANAKEKLGLADRDELRSWPGIRRDSLLHGTDLNMQTSLELGAIGQIGRSVANIAEAERWYAEVLGLKHLFTFGTLAFFDCGGVRLFLEQGSSQKESVIYFRVPDIRAAHAHLQERGVQFESPPHLIHRHEDGTEEWMAFFYDNEGRLLSIMSQLVPTTPTEAPSA
ncbi:VOC family protein [Phenylobacterium sp.]|uniref:VOC family protein n=1 Tax=Phenylobacterium sp. TaxID=1871053 RepID=UPI0025EC1BB9|nr:VOC family protein [Phenylobacterium sp.]